MEHSVECKNENKPLIDAKIEIQYLCDAYLEKKS